MPPLPLLPLPRANQYYAVNGHRCELEELGLGEEAFARAGYLEEGEGIVEVHEDVDEGVEEGAEVGVAAGEEVYGGVPRPGYGEMVVDVQE